MTLKNTLIIFFAVICFLLNTPLAAQAQEITPLESETLEAVITKISKKKPVKFELVVTHGSINGRTLIIDSGEFESSRIDLYKVGDKVQVSSYKDINDNEVYFITDYVRRIPLALLAALFVVCTIAIGGIWGITSLIGMGFSFLVIFLFVLPQLLAGHDPLLIAVLGAAVIIPVTFYLSHGFNIKTHVAIVGTLITLVSIGGLAHFFVNLAHLTGFAAEEVSFLQTEIEGKIDARGLLLAGIIISSLGILDDITISQSSVIKELREANKKLSRSELFSRGMRVGRDHIASLVNTLVLVYAGASLPLLLLFINTPHPLSEVINYEIIAEEIVKTLVGSIGLVLAVPITTALSVFYFSRHK